MKKYGQGWFNESERHRLARLGIKTGRKVNYSFFDKKLPWKEGTSREVATATVATTGGALFGSLLGPPGAVIGAGAGYGGMKAYESVGKGIEKWKQKRRLKEAEGALKGSEDYVYVSGKGWTGRIDTARNDRPPVRYILAHIEEGLDRTITKGELKKAREHDIPEIIGGFSVGTERRLAKHGYTEKERTKVIKAIQPKLRVHLERILPR